MARSTQQSGSCIINLTAHASHLEIVAPPSNLERSFVLTFRVYGVWSKLAQRRNVLHYVKSYSRLGNSRGGDINLVKM
jgi:hypothetical protein